MSFTKLTCQNGAKVINQQIMLNMQHMSPHTVLKLRSLNGTESTSHHCSSLCIRMKFHSSFNNDYSEYLSPRRGGFLGLRMEERLPIQKEVARILNKQSRTADKMRSFSLGLDEVLTTPHRKNWPFYETNGGKGQMHTGFCWVNLRDRDHLKYPGVCGRIILRWIFRK